jgi:hypothetical protein
MKVSPQRFKRKTPKTPRLLIAIKQKQPSGNKACFVFVFLVKPYEYIVIV